MDEQAADLERRIFSFSDMRPEYPCWMANGDKGPSYCRACAEKKAAETNDDVDGGYRRYENDGCCHCTTCGVVLDYELTEYGTWEELRHFQKRRFKSPPSREEAYHIGCLLRDAAMWAGSLRPAMRIAVRFAAMLPPPPSTQEEKAG